MASPEHLDILSQGVKIWNRWRQEEPGIRPNLSEANLSKADLTQADLSRSDLGYADLSFAILCGVNLGGADLSLANLSWADLSQAKLSGASLIGADISQANLTSANLFRANLNRTDLTGTNLNRTDFTLAKIGWTKFEDVDFSGTHGLDTVRHNGPSYLDIHTLYRSQGKIPESFLRGTGVPETFLSYLASFNREAIQYYSCFISHSSKDEAFAQRLHADLQQNGVRCWFAPEDMKIGDKIRPRIDESIRIHDKLLLILSENSLNSFWVESEVEKAFEEEVEGPRCVSAGVRAAAAGFEGGGVIGWRMRSILKFSNRASRFGIGGEQKILTGKMV
jgi:uncharacterized protein YjbI with pentapeptide repeats